MNVEGVGERSANGSSLKRSEGGELRGASWVSEVGLMGIAGGSTKCEVEAAAECERKRPWDCAGDGGCVDVGDDGLDELAVNAG